MALIEVTISEQGRFAFVSGKGNRLISDVVGDISQELGKAARVHAPSGLSKDIRSGVPVHHSTELVESRVEVFGTKAGYVHEGTGIFGPRKQRIVGKIEGTYKNGVIKRKMLMIRKPEGKIVWRRSARGQRPNPFMREAYNDVVSTYVPIRLLKLKHDLQQL